MMHEAIECGVEVALKLEGPSWGQKSLGAQVRAPSDSDMGMPDVSLPVLYHLYPHPQLSHHNINYPPPRWSLDFRTAAFERLHANGDQGVARENTSSSVDQLYVFYSNTRLHPGQHLQ
jgi:hypothetical protein